MSPLLCIHVVSLLGRSLGTDYLDSVTWFYSVPRIHSGIFFFLWRCGPTRAMACSFLRFFDNTQRLITLGRTPLNEWSARLRDLHLTTHNTRNRQTSMPPCGIRTHNLSRRAAADLRLRPYGHWDRLLVSIQFYFVFCVERCVRFSN